MSENIYDILSKLNGAMGKIPSSTVEVDPIVESIDPDDLSDAVSLLEKKFNRFNPGDENEGNWLNPKAKRTVQLAKAKYPETASDLEAVVAAMGDKTEELDQRDRETGEWMDKAKATIDAQQKEIKRTEQAIVDANARYDAQEKRFQDFTQQVAAADLPVQQQAQAAVDFAKATKDTGAAPEKIAARGKEIVSKAKEKAKAKEKEQPTATASIPQRPSADIYQFPDKEQPAGTQTTATNQQTTNTNQSAKKPAKVKVANIDTARKAKQDRLMTAIPVARAVGQNENKESKLKMLREYREGDPDLGLINYNEALKAFQNAQEKITLNFGNGKLLTLYDYQLYGLLSELTGDQNQERKVARIENVMSNYDSIVQLLLTPKVKKWIQAFPEYAKKNPKFKARMRDVDRGQFKLEPSPPQDPRYDPETDTMLPHPYQRSDSQLEENLGNKTMKNVEQLAKNLMERFANFREEAKPDFLDLDKDGNTEEPMKKAAKDAKEHEPAKPDSDAVAKRKRLQALKDKQEDERAEKDDYDSKSSSRIVKGRAYGGAAQKDDKEDDLDESGLQAYLGKKKYGKEGMQALQKAGREGASKEKMAVLRAKHDKMDEVAPPGAKAERMVKGIKKSLSKDGHLSGKDKAIAYATTWKAHKKGQVEEGTEFGDKIKNSKAELKKHKMVKEGRNPESSEYTYETVGRILSDEQPGLDCNSEAFVKAVYDELIEMKMTPKAARWLVHYDEDFISDTASAYGHFCDSKAKEAMECGAPMNSFVSEEPLLDAEHELAEIAKLAGLTREATVCETCDCDPCSCDEGLDPMAPMDSASPLTYTEEGMGCSEDELNEAATRKDFRMVANLLKSIPDMAKRTELALYHADIFKQQNSRFKKEMFLAAAGVDTTPIKEVAPALAAAVPVIGAVQAMKDEQGLEEEEVGEGNEFSGALAKARADGKKEFEVDGKKYTVKEDININVSANGEEDVVNLIRKLSGMPVVAVQAQPAMAEEVVAEEGPKERDIEYTNTPHEDVAGTDAAIPSGNGEDRAKKMYRKEYPGDNPMAVAEAKEESLWRAYETMINDVKA